VLDPYNEHAAGDHAAKRSARADTASKARRRLEQQIVINFEQLLPGTDNCLRSVEELTHHLLDVFTDFFFDFLPIHKHALLSFPSKEPWGHLTPQNEPFRFVIQ
jgi:hypothetical protein